VSILPLNDGDQLFIRIQVGGEEQRAQHSDEGIAAIEVPEVPTVFLVEVVANGFGERRHRGFGHIEGGVGDVTDVVCSLRGDVALPRQDRVTQVPDLLDALRAKPHRRARVSDSSKELCADVCSRFRYG